MWRRLVANLARVRAMVHDDSHKYVWECLFSLEDALDGCDGKLYACSVADGKAVKAKVDAAGG